MRPVFIEARDLPDAWFQCIYRIFEDDGVHEYVIDRGSFEGNKRREFDLVMVHIKYPGAVPLIPDIPAEDFGNFHTLGGFVLTALGRIPKKGEFFEYAGWRFEVVDVDHNRIDEVLATPLPPPEA